MIEKVLDLLNKDKTIIVNHMYWLTNFTLVKQLGDSEEKKQYLVIDRNGTGIIINYFPDTDTVETTLVSIHNGIEEMEKQRYCDILYNLLDDIEQYTSLSKTKISLSRQAVEMLCSPTK